MLSPIQFSSYTDLVAALGDDPGLLVGASGVVVANTHHTVSQLITIPPFQQALRDLYTEAGARAVTQALERSIEMVPAPSPLVPETGHKHPRETDEDVEQPPAQRLATGSGYQSQSSRSPRDVRTVPTSQPSSAQAATPANESDDNNAPGTSSKLKRDLRSVLPADRIGIRKKVEAALLNGESAAGIARKYNMCRKTVLRWKHAPTSSSADDQERARTSLSRSSRTQLSNEQLEELNRLLTTTTPDKHGLWKNTWGDHTVQAFIYQQFGVWYDLKDVNPLVSYLEKFSASRPVPVLADHDPLIAAQAQLQHQQRLVTSPQVDEPQDSEDMTSSSASHPPALNFNTFWDAAVAYRHDPNIFSQPSASVVIGSVRNPAHVVVHLAEFQRAWQELEAAEVLQAVEDSDSDTGIDKSVQHAKSKTPVESEDPEQSPVEEQSSSSSAIDGRIEQQRAKRRRGKSSAAASDEFKWQKRPYDQRKALRKQAEGMLMNRSRVIDVSTSLGIPYNSVHRWYQKLVDTLGTASGSQSQLRPPQRRPSSAMGHVAWQAQRAKAEEMLKQQKSARETSSKLGLCHKTVDAWYKNLLEQGLLSRPDGSAHSIISSHPGTSSGVDFVVIPSDDEEAPSDANLEQRRAEAAMLSPPSTQELYEIRAAIHGNHPPASSATATATTPTSQLSRLDSLDKALIEGRKDKDVAKLLNLKVDLVIRRRTCLERLEIIRSKYRLTIAQQAELNTLLQNTPRACNYATDTWSMLLVKDFIRDKYGVRYTPAKAAEVLRLSQEHPPSASSAPAPIVAIEPLSRDQMERLNTIFTRDTPRNYGLGGNEWNLANLQLLIHRQFGMSLPPQRVEEILNHLTSLQLGSTT